MAVEKVFIRDCDVEINTGTVELPTWTPIGGLTEPVEHSPSTERTDMTDCDSGGRAEHVVAQRGDAFTFKGRVLEDPATGDRDPGQEACETLAKQIGSASLGQFRISSPGGATITFDASAEVKRFSGSFNDGIGWECATQVSGDLTEA